MFIVYKALTGSLRGKKRVGLKIRINKKFRTLCYGLKRAAGRNITGQITTFHRGGGKKRLYRRVDYWRRSTSQVGIVKRIEYNPFITANVALVEYEGLAKQYILAPEGLMSNNLIYNGHHRNSKSCLGAATLLGNMQAGTFVYNIELRPGSGGQFIRSAGTYGKILKGGTDEYVRIRLASGLIYYFSKMCAASVGRVSNI